MNGLFSVTWAIVIAFAVTVGVSSSIVTVKLVGAVEPSLSVTVTLTLKLLSSSNAVSTATVAGSSLTVCLTGWNSCTVYGVLVLPSAPSVIVNTTSAGLVP